MFGPDEAELRAVAPLVSKPPSAPPSGAGGTGGTGDGGGGGGGDSCGNKAPLSSLGLRGGWDLFKKNAAAPPVAPASADASAASAAPASDSSDEKDAKAGGKKDGKTVKAGGKAFGDGFESRALSSRWTLVYSKGQVQQMRAALQALAGDAPGR